MRILIDENLDWRLKRDLPGHEVSTVQAMGWQGLQNGDLLRQAQTRFDVLLTHDSGIPFQQNLSNYRIAIIILKARSNRLQDTQPLMEEVLKRLAQVSQGRCFTIP
jgi:predicted nuclease of predicted toxin-antitoxin system